ncbi:hypothetical protein [Weissella halotolerans]|uniref:Uncharacterized protein n=1 Tax=Weissella halotolerans DSM 20190 TaxID=1123500 RepID=A0A0R2FVM0_9LACO|nr:hypothetical protein [Weissella halotolerans]KRN32467.1 hypothetical protein IV68_GL000821 [Weissella halotolerans DSM 20190]
MTERLRERVVNYTDLIENDLTAIQDLLANARMMAQSDDPVELHQLAGKLTQAQLPLDWVKVPRQYSHADWYLIAMDRFLELAGISGFDILMPATREEVTMIIPELGLPVTFEFDVNQDENGGAYFVELATGYRLFYWSLERKQLLFNAKAITDLLVAKFRPQATAAQIRTISIMLTEFGRYLERTFDYQVDYNILETQDSYHYPLVQNEMPAGMLDRLFVLSAETDYFLQSIPQGAAIMLDNQVEVRIFYEEDEHLPGQQQWYFQVIDGRDAVSWLDVLMDYDFIGAWYLKERKAVEVTYDQLVFAQQTSQPREISPLVGARRAPMIDETVVKQKVQPEDETVVEEAAGEPGVEDTETNLDGEELDRQDELGDEKGEA